jgi:hypothetical protein
MVAQIDFLLFYGLSELSALVIFKIVRKKYLGKNSSKAPIWTGILERIFIYLCILTGVYHGLTLFGALKIGTRIRLEENKISNEYFLIGNMISVGLVLLTVYIYQIIN